ncbi:MAG: uracil-DNA glycosylase family protein [Bacteroidota bacterium]|jgi:uracil-DNA glycosylase
MVLQSILAKRFGQRIKQLTLLRADGLHFLPDQIQKISEPNLDKCQDCPARIFRQDIPFWIGPHSGKKVMVIAQDAGKGIEDHGLNTVFSIHNAHLDPEAYFKASPRHEGYFNLFRDVIGHDRFLHDIYFTDIVKCAYSTDAQTSFSSAVCKEDILMEIEAVNPKGLILMGKAAQTAFSTMSEMNGMKLSVVTHDSCQINSRGQIHFVHYTLNTMHVFFIPHLIGNLHIARDMKEEFLLFKNRITSCIQKTLNEE